MSTTMQQSAHAETKKSRRPPVSPQVLEIFRRHYPYARDEQAKLDVAEMGRRKMIELKGERPETVEPWSIDYTYSVANRAGVTRTYRKSKDGTRIEEDAPEPCYDPRRDPARLLERESFTDTVFSQRDDEYLRQHWGEQFIEQIAFMRGHTETAIMWRARQLGLRQPVQYFDVEKVTAWLGIDQETLVRLGQPVGLKIHECCDQHHRVAIRLVEAVALARMLVRDGLFKELLARRDADEFFIREVIGSVADVRAGRQSFAHRWVSHGQTCLNPYSGASFGLFMIYDENGLLINDLDRYGRVQLPGYGLEVEELSPERIHELIDLHRERPRISE